MQQFNMKQKEEYKETEIGLLPENWRFDNIVNYVDFQRGTEPGSDKYNKNGEGIRFLRVVDISGSRDDKIYTTLNNVKECQEVDILITFDGSPGIIKRGLKGAYSSGIRKVIIKDKEKIKLDFIYYVLQTNFVQDIIQEYSTGVTIKHASKSIPHIKIPLPSYPEQKKIVAVLSAVQETKEKTEEVIKATKELKKSMMKYLFTCGPVSVKEAENVPLKETKIGMMPEEWEVEKISRTCKVKSTSIALPILPSIDTRNDGDLLVHGIKVSDMNLPQNKREILGANIEVRLPKKIAEKKAIPSMSIVFPKRGAAIATNKKRLTTTWTILDPNLIAVVPNQTVNPYFLYYWFLIFNIKSIQSPGPTPQLNKKDVEPVQFPLPPFPIQQKIASILSIIDLKIEKEGNKKEALEELFKSMLHNLMTAKIRVNNLEI